MNVMPNPRPNVSKRALKLGQILAGSLLMLLSFLSPVASADSFALSNLPDLIDRIKPSIVVIGTYSQTRSPAFVMRGTGFVIGDGTLIATNAHVIPQSLDSTGGEMLVVQLVVHAPAANKGGQQRMAKVAATDKEHDLSLLRIEGAPLTPMVLHTGKAPAVREGQGVAFIGFPIGGVLGLSPVTHRGIISAITPIVLPGPNASQLNAKVIRSLKRGAFEVYQLDGTAYPGNSGGPLFEVEKGEVIGIINMVFVKGTKESLLSQPSGISFAIPAVYLADLLEDLR